MKKLINAAKKGWSLQLFLKQERRKSFGIKKSYKNLSKGFFSISERLYDFSVNDPKNYLSDWQRIYLASRINGHQKIVLDDKILFHANEAKNPSVLPLLYFIRKKRIWKKVLESYELVDTEVFFSEVRQFESGLIIKPSTGGGGNGIFKVEDIEGELEFSGDCKDKKAFIKIVESGRDFVITEVLRQTGKMAEIHPNSINTLRVLVMRDPETGKPFIARAVQRVGTNKSGIVDNWSAGGLSIDVDVKTGKMGEGASCSTEGSLEWKETHPDTNIHFFGMRIPFWNEIVEEVVTISEKYFFLPYIGWDVVPMEEEIIILEGNTNSDVNLLQIHKGLLEDYRIRQFYNYHKVI